jgi:hypothetical protein
MAHSFEHFQVSENTLDGEEGGNRALSGYHSFESIPISKHGRDRRSNSGLERKKSQIASANSIREYQDSRASP